MVGFVFSEVASACVVVGSAIAAAAVVGANRDRIAPLETRVFRAVNGLPGWLYWPLWPPMQLGNLVVGTLAGLAVAVALESRWLAIHVVLAMILKLVVERVVRHRLSPEFVAVRQRPGTSEPGAILRGRDVPAQGASFPSGHVILVAAISAVLTTDLSATGVAVAWSLTALVMVGRVYVGAHNPLDVTAGLGIGLLVGGVIDMVFA